VNDILLFLLFLSISNQDFDRSPKENQLIDQNLDCLFVKNKKMREVSCEKARSCERALERMT